LLAAARRQQTFHRVLNSLCCDVTCRRGMLHSRVVPIGFEQRHAFRVPAVSPDASVASSRGMGDTERAGLPVQRKVFLTIRVMVWCVLRSQDIDARHVLMNGSNQEDSIGADFDSIVSADTQPGSPKR